MQKAIILYYYQYIIKLYYEILKIKELYIEISLRQYPAPVYVSQSYPTLCNSIDYRPLGSSVHGILQDRILEWVAIPISRGSSWLKDCTASYIAGRLFILSYQGITDNIHDLIKNVKAKVTTNLKILCIFFHYLIYLEVKRDL